MQQVAASPKSLFSSTPKERERESLYEVGGCVLSGKGGEKGIGLVVVWVKVCGRGCLELSTRCYRWCLAAQADT